MIAVESVPLKVLHVMGGLDAGGSETLVLNYMRALSPSGVKFDFVKHVSHVGIYEEEIKSLGGSIIEAPRFKVLNYRSYAKWWDNFFSSHNGYDIVHGHMRSTASVYLGIAKRYGCATVAHSHAVSDEQGVSALVKTRMYKGISSVSDARLACSKKAGEWLFGPDFLQKCNDAVLPNAINTASFAFCKSAREEIRQNLSIDDGTFLYGHVGRFVPQKNHSFLIDVFASIYESNPNTALILVGDGPDRGSIENLINCRGLANCVHLVGQQMDIGRFYSAMDALLLTSPAEGFGNVLIEGQTSGLPCLASTGVPISTNVLGQVQYIPLSDGVYAWRDASLGLVDCRPDESTRVEFSRKMQAGEYEIGNTAAQLITLYQRLV